MKIVREYLFESFESQKEIEALTDDILIQLSYHFKEIQQPKGLKKITTNPIEYTFQDIEIEIKDLYTDKYITLKDFIQKSDVAVQFEKTKNVRGGAYYPDTKLIVISIDTKILYDEYKQYGKLNPYIFMYDKNKNDESAAEALIHELQHAYDAFVSKGKFTANKQNMAYRQQLTKPVLDHLKDVVLSILNPKKTKEKAVERYKQYLQLPYEINARFTSAIQDTEFVAADEMIDWDAVLKNFTKNFYAWSIMPDDVKKRLIRKLSQFWHKYSDEINRIKAEKSRKQKLLDIRTKNLKK